MYFSWVRVRVGYFSLVRVRVGVLFSWVKVWVECLGKNCFKCFSVKMCVRAESILASYLLAKEARGSKSGIVKLKPLFFPNHTATPTLIPIRKRKVPKVTSKNLFQRWTVRAEITFISNIVSPMGVRRRLEALTDNSSKFRDHRKHLSPSTITSTLTLTLLKYPYPNLNLTLIQNWN